MSPPPPPPPPIYNPHVLEANGRHQAIPEAKIFIVFLNVINALTQLLLGAVAFSAFCMASIFEVATPFSQHIYLCVIGYVILMSQAILSFNTHAGWTYALKYPEKRMIHWFMQVFGSIFAIAGSIVSIVDVENNFQTAHGITGLIAMLLTILSLIGGLLNFAFSSQASAVLFKTLHSCIGCLTVTVAFTCLCLAFTDWYRYLFGDINANISITFTALALAGILISSLSSSVKRVISGK